MKLQSKELENNNFLADRNKTTDDHEVTTKIIMQISIHY